jgi:hypothetical protein
LSVTVQYLAAIIFIQANRFLLVNVLEPALSTGNPGKIHVFFIKEPLEAKWQGIKIIKGREGVIWGTGGSP